MIRDVGERAGRGPGTRSQKSSVGRLQLSRQATAQSAGYSSVGRLQLSRQAQVTAKSAAYNSVSGLQPMALWFRRQLRIESYNTTLEQSRVMQHIWLDPETVCSLDFDPDRACSAGPDPA